jgi:hypothetical protein
MAIKKVIDIDIRSDSKQADKSFKEIKKDIDSIGKSADKNLSGDNLKKVTEELKNTEKAAKSTKNRLRELEDEMADIGDVNSPQFQKLAKEAGGLKDKINNAKAAVKSMSADFPRLQVGTQAFSAMGGAAQGAMGASQLLGSENEEVARGLQKLVAVQSILNAVTTVSNALSDETALGLKLRASLGKIKVANDLKQTASVGSLTLAQKAQTIVTWLSAGAMKAFGIATKGAMLPITIIILAVTAAIAIFSMFSEETESTAEANDKLTASLDKQTAALEKNRAASERSASDRRRQLLIDGASEEELHLDTIKRLDEEQATRLQEFSERQKGINKQSKLYKKALKEGDNELAKSIGDRLRADRKSNETLLLQKEEHSKAKQEEDKRYADSVVVSDKTVTDNNKAELDRRRSNYKAFLDKKLAAERRIEDLKNSLIKDDEDKALAIRRTKFARDIEDLKTSGKLGNETKKLLAEQLEMDLADIKKKATDKEIQADEALAQFKKAADEKLAAEKEAFEETLYQQGLTKDEAEIQAVTAKYFNLIALAEQYGLDTVALKEKETAELEAIEQAAAKDKRKSQLDTATQAADVAASSFKSLGDLATAFAGNNEKAQRRAFKINKVASIAQATIDTFKSANAAFSSMAAIPVVGPALGGIAAAAAVAAGIANIKKISSTQFQGGGGGSISASAPPSIGGGGGSQPAQFNIIGGTGINQLAEGLGGQNSQPIQTYVVSGDVTTAQGLDRNKIDTATI